MNSKRLILILIFVFLTASVFLSLKWRTDNKFEKIIITGNYTIPSQEILDAARLTDSVINENEINIDVIQDRIMKHPEVKKAFVSKDQPSELKIEIIEKRPVAILNGENEIKLIDDELDVFPFKNSSKLYDLPVISGVRIESTPNPKNKYNKEDLRTGLFIILNSYKDSKAMYNNISEINFSDPDKIIVYLSEDSSPFYFPGRNGGSISDKDYQDLLKNKLVLFDSYLKQSLDNHIKKNVNYVDLRYSNQVIVNSNN